LPDQQELPSEVGDFEDFIARILALRRCKLARSDCFNRVLRAENLVSFPPLPIDCFLFLSSAIIIFSHGMSGRKFPDHPNNKKLCRDLRNSACKPGLPMA